MSDKVWVDETKWDDATDLVPEQSPEIFMQARGIDREEMRERLRDYRDQGNGSSPWAYETTGVLTTDFINWDGWER